MPKKSSTKRSAKAVKSAKSTISARQENSYLKLRRQIESMRILHAIVLVLMVSLTVGLIMLMSRQKQEIDRLKFQVDFLEERYDFWREQGVNKIEAGAEEM